MKRSLFLLSSLLATWGHAAPFPIGGFSPSPEQDQAAGFTIAGPVYSKERDMLATCEAIRMPFIYPIGVELDFTAKKSGKEPESLDEKAIRESIRRQVEEVMDSSCVYAWYLTPEELRNWKPLEMEYLRIATEVIHKTDPQKRPIWMYEPNHRTRAALEKTLPFQQISGKGLYANYAGRQAERAWVSWSMDQQNQAIAAVNPSAKVVAVLEMFQNPDEADLGSIRDWVRHDSYAALINGAKAIIVYSFANRKGFTSRDDYYQAYVEIARDLNGDKKLGDVFLEGSPVPAPTIKLIQGSPHTSLSGRKSAPTEDIMVPSFTSKALSHEGKEYFFLLNSSPEPLTFSASELAKWTPVFGSSVEDTLQLKPWEVVAFTKQP